MIVGVVVSCLLEMCGYWLGLVVGLFIGVYLVVVVVGVLDFDDVLCLVVLCGELM